ncbi:MAG: hypothetical protein EXX96DRAFT_260868 [Benjaminiella poitrasii]|nr:MAG: hypothetical protein EXX96DRAFT_260868 [Benjaminiella poitrasii]
MGYFFLGLNNIAVFLFFFFFFYVRGRATVVNSLILVATEPPSTSDPTEMRRIAQQFYADLYNPDPADLESIDRFLSQVSFTNTVDEHDNIQLDSDISKDEIIQQLKVCHAKTSSPGHDGFGYQFLSVLFDVPAVSDLTCNIFNEALSKQVRVRLLPKKGDLQALQNWRPISLINCDAKIFT